MKKVIGLILVFVLAFTAFVGCGNDSTEGEGGETEGASGAITVVTREEGSGTRDGFTELMGIKVDDVDNTTQTAEVSNSTSVVMTTVAGNVNAIGYISLGSLNDTIKAVSVDGVEANVDNILSGEYPIYRPFNIVTNSNNDLSALAQDFITFIMSKQGQDIITEEGYISEAESPAEYAQQEGLSAGADFRFPGKYRNIFLRAGEMRPGAQEPAWPYLYAVGLKRALALEGEGRIIYIFPAVLPEGRNIPGANQQLRLGVIVHERGKGHLVAVGKLPEDRNGRVHVALLNLRQHAP